MLTKTKEILSRPLNICILSIVLLYFALLAFLTSYLHYNSLISDVASYWQDSLQWQHPFFAAHVPLYALTIALFRGLTFNILPPLLIMRTIIFFATIFNVVLFFRLIKQSGLEDRWAVTGTLVFMLWPFVGIIDAVDPISDFIMVAFYLAGLVFLMDDKFILSGCMFGLALISHKASWPIIGLTFLLWLVLNWKQHRIAWLFGAILTAFPFILYWISGSLYYHNLLWIVSLDLSSSASITSGQTLLFSSLAGTFKQAGLNEIVKSILTITIFVSTIVLFLGTLLKWNQYSKISLPIIITVFLLIALFSYDAQWYTVRFSRLLTLPLIWQTGTLRPKLLDNKYVLFFLAVILIVLIITQFGMAWYLPVYFHKYV